MSRAEVPGGLEARLYKAMSRIRRVEERVAGIYPSDKIKSPTHLSIGQESVSVGVCEALRPDDIVFGTYRGHALYLAKGGDLRGMIAELYGRATGCAKGKGGSMHLADASAGMMGTSAVVATTIPTAVGYAYACRYRRKGTVVASFFGDGAVEEGAFWESINFASLRSLPILFVCENNLYAIHSPLSLRQPDDRLVDRVRSFGIRAERVDANDVVGLHRIATGIVASLRSGESGPVFLECMTYRWREHVGPREDFDLGYRTREEADSWVRHDPVAALGGVLDRGLRDRIDREIESELDDAVGFAEASPFPGLEELHSDLFMEVQ
jgi:TPP-dependent pyruvate/acetoin dehydrogenase alpha subunit